MVNKALPLSKTTARVHVKILGVANVLTMFDLQRSLRTRGGRALGLDLDAAAGEHVKDVSGQFQTPGAHTDQVPFTASPIEERTEDKASGPSSSADVHGSAARHDGQRGASDPKTMGGHVSEGWNNNNPFVALSPDHGVDEADQTEELHNGDGSRGKGRHQHSEVPTYPPETHTEAEAQRQPNAGADALRRNFGWRHFPVSLFHIWHVQYDRVFLGGDTQTEASCNPVLTR
jgi:hypothetical protein